MARTRLTHRTPAMQAARAAAIAASQATAPPPPAAVSASTPAAPRKHKRVPGATKPKTKKQSQTKTRRVFLELCCECGETQDSDYTVLVTKGGGYVCCACYVYKALAYVADQGDGDPEWPYQNPRAGPYHSPSGIFDVLGKWFRVPSATASPTQ